MTWLAENWAEVALAGLTLTVWATTCLLFGERERAERYRQQLTRHDIVPNDEED